MECTINMMVGLLTLFLIVSPCLAAQPPEVELRSGRRLLQSVLKPCPTDFTKLDYSSVTGVCKGPNYSTSSCCPPFKAIACEYKSQVNDFSSTCPIFFLSGLNAAGKYPDGVFIGRCSSGSNGIC